MPFQTPAAEIPAPPTDSEDESDHEAQSVLETVRPTAAADEVPFPPEVFSLTINFNGLKMDVDKEPAAPATESRSGSGAVPTELHFKKKARLLVVISARFSED